MSLATTAELPVRIDELRSFTARNGHEVKPGCYGLSHGSGPLADLIRHATQSWAGHAFIYIGNGHIIEGTPPHARVASVDAHPDGVYNTDEDLTADQRIKIVDRAQALVGISYDWPAYVGFALEILKIRSGEQLDPVFRRDTSRVCSALVDDCYSSAGIDLFPAIADHNLISPADLYNRIVQGV